MNLERLMKDHQESKRKAAIRFMHKVYNYKNGPQTVKPIYECVSPSKKKTNNSLITRKEAIYGSECLRIITKS